MDFALVAKEIFQWAETPVGALVVYPAAALVGVTAGYCGNVVRKFYEKNFCAPERKPFEGIVSHKLPKSEPKV